MPTEKLLSRKEAAALLGMSMATLRRREGKFIEPVMSPLGEHLFRPMDVRLLAESGAAAAKTAVASSPSGMRRAAERRLARLRLHVRLRAKGQPGTPKTKRGFSGKRLAQIRRAIDDGLTMREVAERLKLTYSQVRNTTRYHASAR